MPTRILLADDSVTIRKVVELTFAETDYEVVAVGDGETALLRARESKPDIILLDVVMPRMSGYDVCSELKRDQTLQDVPVLLLTGAFEEFDASRGEEVGAAGHITKPFESQELISRVRSLVPSQGDEEPLSEEFDPDLLLPELEFDTDTVKMPILSAEERMSDQEIEFDLSSPPAPDSLDGDEGDLSWDEGAVFFDSPSADRQTSPSDDRDDSDEAVFKFQVASDGTARVVSPESDDVGHASASVEGDFEELTAAVSESTDTSPTVTLTVGDRLRSEPLDEPEIGPETVPSVRTDERTMAMLEAIAESLDQISTRLDGFDSRLDRIESTAREVSSAEPDMLLEQAMAERMPSIVEAVSERLSTYLAELLAQRMVANGFDSQELLSSIAWQVVPDVAEMLVRREIDAIREQS